ncbi:MAG: tRNA guanosine(34) transglycosylase Tgt [Chloroflexi bacterium]|nr:tRNA guanosine(34) transglycosylase Tgt [Chloroflexota bacterium]
MGPEFHFQVVKACPTTKARAGLLSTPRGVVPTPAFLPVGSQGAIKTLTPDEIKDTGAKMILSNTYHLSLRPGVETVARLGGLHHFMGWYGPILTDSGGFQVFSLGRLCQVKEEGVLFRSHLDGRPLFLGPEEAVALQEALDGDLAMVLDQCPAWDEDRETVRQATERTHRWAIRCLESHRSPHQALLGIVQGGVFPDLRRESARFIASLPFFGYALGGLSLGEPKEVTYAVAEETAAHLPWERPRYLMGVGSPEDLVEGVAWGIDLFDSALPTRVARNGSLFTRQGRINVDNAPFKEQDKPIEENCDCYTCRRFSAAYLHHLFRSQELLAYRLATIHNLRFVIRLMEEMRASIMEGTFPTFRRDFLAVYRLTREETRQEQKAKWLENRRSREIRF